VKKSDQHDDELDELLEECNVVSTPGIGMPPEYVRKRMSVPTLPGFMREDYLVIAHLLIETHQRMIEHDEPSGTIYLSEEMTIYLRARVHIFDECLKRLFSDASTELEFDIWQGTFHYQKPSVSKRRTR
jgi:hypothetical protein